MMSIKVGDIITVRFSKKLEHNGNAHLVNHSGVITRLYKQNGELQGVYADININNRVRNYYIPIRSIDDSESLNKMRVLSILKSTVL